MTPPALELEGVRLSRGDRPVLRDLSLAVGPSEALALVGRSGTGKTTVLRLLLGLERPDAGVVRLAGEVVSDGPRLLVPAERRRLAIVFQDLALWPHMTALEHLTFVLGAQGTPAAEQEPRASEVLARVGLQEAGARRPGQLSGGERQRVALARALVGNPRAILLDEPLSSLDPLLRRELSTLLRDLLLERSLPAVYVCHDPREAERVCDRVAVLDQGTIVQVGGWSELRSSPASPVVAGLLDPA